MARAVEGTTPSISTENGITKVINMSKDGDYVLTGTYTPENGENSITISFTITRKSLTMEDECDQMIGSAEGAEIDYEGSNVSGALVEIIEGEVCPDHIHLLLSIPPKMSVSGFMGYLKGKSSLIIFQRFGDMKFAYRNREFWCKGYYVDTVGKNTKAIKEYIENQLKTDRESDQISLYDPRDPFTGSK